MTIFSKPPKNVRFARFFCTFLHLFCHKIDIDTKKMSPSIPSGNNKSTLSVISECVKIGENASPRENSSRTIRKHFYRGETPRELFASTFTTGKLLANFSQALLPRGNSSRKIRSTNYDRNSCSELLGSFYAKGRRVI